MTDIKFRSDMTVDLLAVTGVYPDERAIAEAARVSTLGKDTEPGEVEGLVRYLVRSHHTSPLEQVDFIFRIEAPIFVTRQIIRHRTLAINEESGRYRELEGVFYVPEEGRRLRQVGKTGDYEFTDFPEASAYAREVIQDQSGFGWDAYRSLLDAGVAKEVARMVLPVNLYSTMQVKASLHNWLRFITKRTFAYREKPQHEVAMVGDKIKAHLTEHFPVVVDEFDKTHKGDA
jgi:thymidylate synthase (FAD)